MTASVVEHFRGKKLYSFKKKRRKGYRGRLVIVRIDEDSGDAITA